MSKKNLIILGVTVLIFALLFLPQGDKKTGEKTFPKISSPIDKVEQIREKTSGIIFLENNDWKVKKKKNYNADKNILDPVLNFIKNDLTGELVSSSQIYSRYGLDKDKGLEYIYHSQEKPVVKVIIGNNGNQQGSFYLLWNNDPNIYQVKGDRFALDKELDDFIDKKLIKELANQVSSLSITTYQKKKETIKLIKKELKPEKKEAKSNDKSLDSKKVWQDEEKKNYDLNKVNNLINTLVNLNAEEFLFDKKKKDYSKLILKYNLEMNDKRSIRLLIYQKENKQMIAGLANRSDVFRLNENDSNQLAVDLNEFKKK